MSKELREAIAENCEGRLAGALKQSFGDDVPEEVLEDRAEKMAGLFALWAVQDLSAGALESMAE